jgi:hypothetical protein
MIKTESTLIDRYTQIQASNLMHHVRVLASNAMRGRMPGDVGYRRAMDYGTHFFQQNGLAPGFPDNSYEQAFNLETCRVLSASVSLTRSGYDTQALIPGEDFICRSLTGDGHVSGDMVFVGYCSDDKDFNELEGLEIQGKIAVSFKHPPPWHEGRPVLPREKAHRLKKRGAKALVIVPNPNRKQPDRLSGSLVEKDDYIPGFPLIVLSEPCAEKLFDDGISTLSDRQFRIDTLRENVSGSLAASMAIDVETDHDMNDVSWNAAGYLKGSDPVLSRETVVIGAHLDHVGIQCESVVFNGAQDNASGVAAVLEMARVFASGPRLSRSLQFVLFGAEEAGLIGSLHYARNPGQPLENTVAMLNLDCMGAGAGSDMRGRQAYPALFEIFDSMNEKFVGLPDSKKNHHPGGADAKPFEDAGIPNMYFVGMHPYRHLHMVSDTPETLNPALFEGISRLAYLTVAGLGRKA